MSKVMEGEDGEFILVSQSQDAGKSRKRVYGFVTGGKFYVSRFPKSTEKRPANRFDTLEAAEQAAAARGCQIEWET